VNLTLETVLGRTNSKLGAGQSLLLIQQRERQDREMVQLDELIPKVVITAKISKDCSPAAQTESEGC
jgi:hypothetical protein